MIKITDTNSFGKIFGDAISSQSELDKTHIINAKAIYGGTLQKNTTTTLLETFTQDESFVVFYVEHDESGDSMIEDTNEELTTYDSFKVTISCYGNDFDILASNLHSRFLTEELLSYFEQKGVHIQSIDDNGDLSDFLNGYLVKRRDLIIHFSCQIDTTKLTTYEDFEEPNDILEVYSTR